MLDKDQRKALSKIATYNPKLSLGIGVLSLLAAVFEGIGVGFILPIVRLAESGGMEPNETSGFLRLFAEIYITAGVPFTLEYVVGGVIAVIGVRYGASFLVAWLRVILKSSYERHLKTETFRSVLWAKTSYFDKHGADNILNTIVTQAGQGSRSISRAVKIFEKSLISLVYISIALYIAPFLTIITAIILGLITMIIRYGIEPAYTIGDRVAQANEDIHSTVQDGIEGIRDIKMFQLRDSIFETFQERIDALVRSRIAIKRNQEGIDNLYQFLSAITVFTLIYVGLTFTGLSLGALGVFLFAIFRLAPRISTLNNLYYGLEGDLPHIVRTIEFNEEAKQYGETDNEANERIEGICEVSFDEVSFAYEEGSPVLKDVSFEVEKGEFVGFVGQSGAGKSTIATLLAGLYRPKDGKILANGVPIESFGMDVWREKVSIVRQNPYIFNDTLLDNLLVANADASMDEVKEVCEIAKVTEFLDDLPDGFQTKLGDEGVRLSGGQKQRVALARALLKDAEILILDEATSDLDSNIEANVQERIEEMEDDYVLLTIAHRLSTIKNADRIYTVESGRITEVGSHQELIDKNNLYSELYSIQVESD